MVDSWPRMNTRFRTQPTDGCMRVRDGRNSGWKGRGTCSPKQGEPDTGIPEHVRTEIQDAALTALPSQNDRPRQLSTSLPFNSTFSVPSIPDSDRRIHFHGDPERIANGFRIASSTAVNSASIPRSLSEVRLFLFTFWARHAGPLNKVRFWRTPIAQHAHTLCTPVRHSCAHSGGHWVVHFSGHARGQRFREDRARCGAHPFRSHSELSRTPAWAWVPPANECPRARGSGMSQHVRRTWIGLRSATSCWFRDSHRCGAKSAQHSRSGVRTHDCT